QQEVADRTRNRPRPWTPLTWFPRPRPTPPLARQGARGNIERNRDQREKAPVDEHQGLPGKGLLQGPRSLKDRLEGRNQAVLPQTRPGASPGRQHRRSGGGRTIQGDLRGLQRPVGRQTAQGVRRGALTLRWWVPA